MGLLTNHKNATQGAYISIHDYVHDLHVRACTLHVRARALHVPICGLHTVMCEQLQPQKVATHLPIRVVLVDADHYRRANVTMRVYLVL